MSAKAGGVIRPGDADAELALRKSIELSGGQYAEPLFALGAVLAKGEKFSESEGVLREALNLNPTTWAGHYCLGWVLFSMNRFQEAEKSAHEALRLKSDSPEAYLLLANIQQREHDTAAFLKDLDEYLKLVPNGRNKAKIQALRDNAERVIVESPSASAFVQPDP